MPDLPTREEIEESQRICERFDRYEPEEFDAHARTALPERNRQFLALLDRLATCERDFAAEESDNIELRKRIAEKDAEIERLRLRVRRISNDQ